ncbi:ATP-binding protein [Actinomadura sp. WMMB 499]|uniref:ATP-binding protein n=1 Tax=Actinomadura sp. WMMB 499 TaxID=1219491 RepID=UPI00159D22DB|nr:ATP-binding protein [Actinomadura sp. WMMB 499]
MGAPGKKLDVREVRARVRRTLAGALGGRTVGFDLDDIDLMVCEIATNAVRHTASGEPGGGIRVTVMVTASSTRLRVEVQDDGGAAHVPGIPSRTFEWSESGRGLLVVDGLAHDWGTAVDRDGRGTVWFEVVR